MSKGSAFDDFTLCALCMTGTMPLKDEHAEHEQFLRKVPVKGMYIGEAKQAFRRWQAERDGGKPR